MKKSWRTMVLFSLLLIVSEIIASKLRNFDKLQHISLPLAKKCRLNLRYLAEILESYLLPTIEENLSGSRFISIEYVDRFVRAGSSHLQ